MLVLGPSRSIDYRNTYRRCLHFRHFRYVILIVNAIAQHVTEVPQCTLQGICSSFFLCFFEGRSFPFTVLNVAVPDILTSFKVVSVWAHRGHIIHENEYTSWYVPSFRVTLTTTDNPKLIFPVFGLSSTCYNKGFISCPIRGPRNTDMLIAIEHTKSI